MEFSAFWSLFITVLTNIAACTGFLTRMLASGFALLNMFDLVLLRASQFCVRCRVVSSSIPHSLHLSSTSGLILFFQCASSVWWPDLNLLSEILSSFGSSLLPWCQLYFGKWPLLPDAVFPSYWLLPFSLFLFWRFVCQFLCHFGLFESLVSRVRPPFRSLAVDSVPEPRVVVTLWTSVRICVQCSFCIAPPSWLMFWANL